MAASAGAPVPGSPRIQAFVELLLPPRCAGCRAAPGPWRLRDALCPACRACLRPAPPWRDAPGLLAASAARYVYAGPAIDWIGRFKYPARGLAGLDPAPLAVVTAWMRALAPRVPGPPPDLIVPVPLHAGRLRARRFNPAALLARELSRASGGRFAPDALERVRATTSQTGFDAAGRRRNVAGAFAARRLLRGNVWLVDDVATTGSTLSECAAHLLGAGAARVVAVTAARALAPGEATRPPGPGS